MKKIFILVFIAICVVAFFLIKERSTNKKILKYAYASNSQVVKDAMAEFGSILSNKTKGSVVVEYYPDGQLGGERELIEMVQTGVINFTKISASALESFSSIYSIFGLPYLFDSEAHFYKVMDSDIMEDFYNSTEKLGFIGLTYYDSGQRSFYTKDRPINSIKDLHGLKIRVMQSETAIEMIKLMGGSPVPMSSSEVYTTLQQGIIDGSENNEFALTDARHGEVVKYYSYDEHTRVPDIVIMSKATLDLLDDYEKKCLYEAANESTIFQKSKWKESVSNAQEKIKSEFGVQFNYITNKTEFKNATMIMHEQFKTNDKTKFLYNRILELSKD